MVNPPSLTPTYPLLSVWMVAAIAFWQSVHKFKTFPPQASDDRSSCTCSDASFILWLFEWQNNWQSAHRKQSAIWCGERCHIKPSDHLFFGTEVLLFGMTIIYPGNVQSVGSDERWYHGSTLEPRKNQLYFSLLQQVSGFTQGGKKKWRTNGECPYFPEVLARRQTPKKEWESCMLITQMQSLLQTDMSAYCLFQDYSVCFSQSRGKKILLLCF